MSAAPRFPTFVSAAEAARRVGVTSQTMREWIRRERIAGRVVHPAPGETGRPRYFVYRWALAVLVGELQK